MDIAIARQAGELATKRDRVATLLENINASIAIAAPIIAITGAMQADGQGEKLSCLPFGPANPENSAEVWQMLLAEYTKMLGELDKEIAKLDGPAIAEGA